MLELTDLRKQYGDVRALEGLTFRATPGRMLGLLGPNGSGKTTSMRAVFGLVRLDGGSVRWRGEPVAQAVRARFGYMPEERGMYPRMRVGDQLVYFARLHGLSSTEARRAVLGWLERLGLADRINDRVDELSHGNQQRVQLAVALAHAADLVVLDEPFSGLDPFGVETLGQIVRDEAARGAAVIFSSHQLDLVQDLCDDVAIVNRGRVVLDGALDAVRAASPYRYVEYTIEDRAHLEDGALSSIGPDAEVLWRRNGTVRLRVPRAAQPGAVLAALAGEAPPSSFRFEPPSLSDLFHEAVQA